MEGITWRLILVLIAIALGTNFQLYSNSVINNLISVAEPWFNHSFTHHYSEPLSQQKFHTLWSFSAASLQFGAIFGSMFTRTFAESILFGRRRSLMLVSLTSIIGGILAGISKPADSFEIFILARFILGLTIGAGTGLGVLFATEVAPSRYRGACGTIQQLSLGFGNFLSLLLTLPEILGTDVLWPYAVAFPLIPGVIQLLTLIFSPESPRYLFLTRHDEVESRKSIAFYQGPQRVRQVLYDLQNEMYIHSNSAKQVGFLSLWRHYQTRRPLFLSIMINFGVQMSGIGAVMAYSMQMFSDAGLDPLHAKYATVGLGIFNFLSPFLTIALVEYTGRRCLLFSGFFLCLVCLGLLSLLIQGHTYWSWSLATAYATIPCLYLYQVGFAISSSISWIVPAELFPQNARASAVTVVIFSRWVLQCITVLCYLPFRDAIHSVPLSFVPFMVCIVIAGAILWKLLPETKGKTFQEISQYFGGYMSPNDETENHSVIDENEVDYGSITPTFQNAASYTE